MGPVLILGLLLTCCACVPYAAYADLTTMSYEAEINAGGDFPSPASSSFTLRGTLDVQMGEQVAVLRLRDVSTRLYNGATNVKDAPHSAFLPLVDTGVSELLAPFTVHLQQGVVIGLSGVDGHADWSVNMKRAIASLAPANQLQANTSAYILAENGLYGLCNTEYTSHTEGDNVIVRKYLDHSSCSEHQSQFYSNVPVISPYCPAGQDDYLTSSSEITTVHNGGKLVSVDAKGAIYTQLFKARGELQKVTSRQRLTVLSSSPVTSPLVSAMGATTDLKLRLPRDDATQGRNPLKQASAVRIVKRLLTEMTLNLDEPPGQADPTKLHDERVLHVLYFMGLLERASLQELFDEYAVGTSYMQETLRNLFLQLLPRVGSRHSILLIRDMVVEKRVRDDVAQDLLRDLPFHVHKPTDELLRECEVLYSLPEELGGNIRTAGILAFSTLVFQTCQKQCSPDVQDKYVRSYFQLFKGAPTYHLQMLYLEGLSNMEDGRVFEYLQPVIHSRDSNDHLRFLAVWATMNKAVFHPSEVYALYWPILSDVGERLEMRVAALTMLLVSQPSVGRFFSLHWFMTAETCPRLKHFYYTTLQSLVNTKDPCYSLMSDMAGKVLRLLPVPPERHWASGNYILDQGNQEQGFGSMAQLFLVAGERSELPSVFYLMIGSHAIGQRFHQMSVYLKVEGVSNAIKQRLSSLDPALESIPQLAALLREIQASPATDTPLHVELLVKKEGRVMMSAYYNGTTFDKMSQVLGSLQSSSQEQHFNLQDVDNELLTSRTVMTDLGMPAMFLASASHVASLRGNISVLTGRGGVFELSQEHELRMSSTAINNLQVYNPVADVWQGVQRSTNLRYVIPIEGSLGFVVSNKTLHFNIVRRPEVYAGLLGHVRSSVYMRGFNAEKQLRSHCESCKPLVTISRGHQFRRKTEFLDMDVSEVGARLQGEIFDCEHHNGIQALRTAARAQNYQVFPASQPFVIASHVLDSWLMVAPPGSCGTHIKLTTTDHPSELEGLLSLTSSELLYSAHLMLKHKSGSKTLQTWTLDARCQHANNIYNVSLNLMRDGSDVQRKLCIVAALEFPSSPQASLVRLSDPVTATAKFHWVTDDDERLCEGVRAEVLPIQLSFFAETTAEQATLSSEAQDWPFDACKAGNSVDACEWAAREMATLRKYTVALNYSAPLEPAMFYPLQSKDNRLEASVEVSATRPVVYVSVGTDKLTLNTGRRWIEPFLINTRYPLLKQAAIALDLIPTSQPSNT